MFVYGSVTGGVVFLLLILLAVICYKRQARKGNCTHAAVAQSKGIQDSLECWIPCRRLRIPGTGFLILCQWNLDPGFQSVEGFQIP